MTMGTREETKGGTEWDMSSRKARRIVGGRAGSWSWPKAKFWRRVRKLRRLEAEADAAEYDPAGDAAMARLQRLRDTEYLWRPPGSRTMREREAAGEPPVE